MSRQYDEMKDERFIKFYFFLPTRKVPGTKAPRIETNFFKRLTVSFNDNSE